MTRPPRVLIVDDDADLAQLLTFSLEGAGFLPSTQSTVVGAVLAARTEQPDLILVDLRLPDGSGNDVCRQLKADPATRRIPFIVVTALGSEVDRVVGFELGADDYVVKPFSVRELILRIRVVLRRVAPRPSTPDFVIAGRLSFDAPARRVYVDGVEVALTPIEFGLLAVLIERRGRVQDRETLVRDLWGRSSAVGVRAVDTHVTRLRRKLGAAGAYVRGLREVGYGFMVEPGE